MVRPTFRPHTRPALPRNAEPWVIAHRGASSEVAEHTLTAYLEAIDKGADGLECDVRLTRDGHLVCVHDRTVNRTSNGSGLVSELDLEKLQQFDFSSWRHDLPSSADHLLTDNPYLHNVEPDRLAADSARVLTLEKLLSVVADAGRPLKLLIETKHPTRYGGLVEKELVRLLTQFGWASGNLHPVTIMSFAPIALRRIRLLAPDVPLVLLLDRWQPGRRNGHLPTGITTAGAGLHLLRADPGYVARAHAHGNRVFCWTVDNPIDVEFVSRLGVDAIITNRPAAVLDQLSRSDGSQK
jgi:glycerophosphoryl diester phosphodiesterase